MNHLHSQHPPVAGSGRQSQHRLPAPYAWICWGALAGAATLLAYAHWIHIAPYIPLAIFLVCPLMHLFMHGSHGGHGGHGHHQSGTNQHRRSSDRDNAVDEETPNVTR